MSAPPTITTCTTGFFGAGITIRDGNPHDAFIASGSVVKHFSGVTPGPGTCSFGSQLADIPLGSGIVTSWGVALDVSGNLYVAASTSYSGVDTILVSAPPYTSAPSVFYSSGNNFRFLDVHGSMLYVADYGAGTILRFNLNVGPSSVTTFASVTSVFGLFAAGVDDLYVTTNPSGSGTGTVEHVTPGSVSAVATGLNHPEGLGGDDINLYIASNGRVITVPITGGSWSLYALSPILFTHGVIIWKGAGYVTDTHDSGEVHKFTLL